MNINQFYPANKGLVIPLVGTYDRDPTSADLMNPLVGGVYALGSVWINKSTYGVWFFCGNVAGAAVWQGVTDPASGNVDGPASSTDNALARFDSTTGKIIQNSIAILTDAGILTGVTSMGIGIAPTAILGLKAGTATAGTAPLKFASGTNLTAPEAGAVEYDGTNLTYTDGTLTRRAIVSGPAVTVDNTIPRFDGTTGKLLQTSLGVIDDAGVVTGLTGMGLGIAPTAVLTLPAATAVAGTASLKITAGVNLTVPEAGAIEFNGTRLAFTDGGGNRLGIVTGPATSADNAVARFDSTTGKIIQDSAVTMADTTGVMTFPSGGGNVLTAGAGAAERKGSFTFDGSGTHTKILTTAAVTECVIVYTYVTLGTVTVAQAVLTTIDTGVGFTPVSAANNDSSVVNWAIVG